VKVLAFKKLTLSLVLQKLAVLGFGLECQGLCLGLGLDFYGLKTRLVFSHSVATSSAECNHYSPFQLGLWAAVDNI